MHPDAAFRMDDRVILEGLIEQVTFGMVFATTPDGPRVAHTPILSTGRGTVRFHLSNGNGLTRHLAPDGTGSTALVVINGPDSYVSPRWYGEPGQVPTWNYVALELEGQVQRMDRAGLEHLLADIGTQQEARIDGGGTPWTPGSVPQEKWQGLIRGITGFEMAVQAWRPTFKLSQNKSNADRAAIADALHAQGSRAISALIRRFEP